MAGIRSARHGDRVMRRLVLGLGLTLASCPRRGRKPVSPHS